MPAPDTNTPDHIAAVRRFNRFYTQRLGVLQGAWLDSPYSLTEARVLYELHRAVRLTATDIAREIGIDAGYLSRILRRFEDDGMIRREASSQDGRQSFLALTARGEAAFAPLEAGTVRQVGDALGRLTAAEQERLVAAMRTIEALMADAAGKSGDMTLHRPGPGDLGWVVMRHAEYYGREYGWMENFEGVCAEIVADFAQKHDPKRERCWIARMDGRNVGSVFLVRETETVARLRLLLVDPLARGRGLGRRLTDECVAFARACGYQRITLWTHQNLTTARHIYARTGFVLTSSEAMRNFGQDVVSEVWDLTL